VVTGILRVIQVRVVCNTAKLFMRANGLIVKENVAVLFSKSCDKKMLREITKIAKMPVAAGFSAVIHLRF